MERNVISGNTTPGQAGVYIIGSGTNSNTVAGNYIGADAGVLRRRQNLGEPHRQSSADRRIETLAVDWGHTPPAQYVGTDRGVYDSANDGGAWAAFGSGLLSTIVSDLELEPQLNLLAAATYGRGAYEIAVIAAPAAVLSLTSATPYGTYGAGAAIKIFFRQHLPPTAHWMVDSRSNPADPNEEALRNRF